MRTFEYSFVFADEASNVVFQPSSQPYCALNVHVYVYIHVQVYVHGSDAHTCICDTRNFMPFWFSYYKSVD